MHRCEVGKLVEARGGRERREERGDGARGAFVPRLALPGLRGGPRGGRAAPLPLLALPLLAALALGALRWRAAKSEVERAPLRFTTGARSPGCAARGAPRAGPAAPRGRGAEVPGGPAPQLPTSAADELDAVVYICASPPEASGGSAPQGPGCNIPLLCNSLHLLRTEAGWGGRVWVVTDVAAQVRGVCPTAEFEAVEPPREGLDSLMGVKNLKRRLFRILPGAPRSLLYVDGDILPVGCLEELLGALRGVALGLFGDTWCAEWWCRPFATARFNRFNGGMIFMRNTPPVARCLEAWGAEIAAGSYAKDQDALDAVLEGRGGRGGSCAVAQRLPSRLMQAVDGDLFWPALDVARGKRPVFQHFSHGLRQRLGWSRVYAAIERQMASRMPADWLPPSRMLLQGSSQEEAGSGGGGGGAGGRRGWGAEAPAAPTERQTAEWLGGRLGVAAPGEGGEAGLSSY